jgi:hypothetical protein
MKQRTKANKQGHQAAALLGFEASSLGKWGEWKNAKVSCAACGYQVSWYHASLQRKHRKVCQPMPSQSLPTVATLADSLALYWAPSREEEVDAWDESEDQ